MRLPTLRTWPLPLAVGEDAYQEFTAGTIPVAPGGDRRAAMSLVLVEHERGFMPRVRRAPRRGAPRRGPARRTSTTSVTLDRDDRRRDPADRDPARAQDRRAACTTPAAVHGRRDGAACGCSPTARCSGLMLHPTATDPVSSLVGGIWMLGPTPARRGLRRVLDAGRGAAPGHAPATAASTSARPRRGSEHGAERAHHRGSAKRRARDAMRLDIDTTN